jgi:hypothetical protein
MTGKAPQALQKFAVLVSGPTEALVRQVLAGHIKPHFHMRKNQWRACFREEYSLVVLSRPLRAGQDPAALYGSHAGAGVLILAAQDENAPGSGFAATRDWCKANGYDPVVSVSLVSGGPESENIALALEVVRFVLMRCPWCSEEIDDLEAYMAKANKPLW